MKNILLILMSLIIIALIVYISLNIKCSKVEEQQSKPIASTQKKKTETKDKNSVTNKENYKRKDDDPVYKDVDAYLKSINFNGNVTIYRKDNTMFSKAYGQKIIEHNIPNDENSMYLIGSANKFLTGIMLRQLEDEGKININDNVNKYIPNFQNYYAITVRDLMFHQSGLAKFSPNPNSFGLDSAIESIKQKGVLPEKYHQYNYNDVNYITIAKIIEVATNKSFEQNLKERIIKKADLHFTSRYDDLKHEKYLVRGYKSQPAQNIHTPTYNLDKYDGAGNVYMSTNDMTKLIQAFRTNQLLNKSTTQSLLSEDGKNTYPKPYRYGFYKYEHHQRVRGIFFANDIVAYSNNNYIITLACNKLDQPYDGNTEKALEHIFTNILNQPI